MNQRQLLVLMTKYLRKHKYKVTATKQYILAEGELPVCLVAHLDTVEKKPPTDIYFDKEQGVMWSPQLLGADDRAGVYAIIQIIEAGYKPHVIFTTDEEIGAVGAQALVTQKPDCPLENLKAIFQLDRRGSDDCVFYDCDNPDFTKYVESFGFKEAYGSFSDISIIAPAWGVAAANLSVGYYDEHQKIETLKVRELGKTIERVKKILDNAENMLSYAYIEALKTYGWGYDGSFGWTNRCVFCGDPVTNGQFHSVKENDYSYKVCHHCYNTYYNNNYSKGNNEPFDFSQK